MGAQLPQQSVTSVVGSFFLGWVKSLKDCLYVGVLWLFKVVSLVISKPFAICLYCTYIQKQNKRVELMLASNENEKQYLVPNPHLSIHVLYLLYMYCTYSWFCIFLPKICHYLITNSSSICLNYYLAATRHTIYCAMEFCGFEEPPILLELLEPSHRV